MKCVHIQEGVKAVQLVWMGAVLVSIALCHMLTF
jgi:hypothetical protein